MGLSHALLAIPAQAGPPTTWVPALHGVTGMECLAGGSSRCVGDCGAWGEGGRIPTPPSWPALCRPPTSLPRGTKKCPGWPVAACPPAGLRPVQYAVPDTRGPACAPASATLRAPRLRAETLALAHPAMAVGMRNRLTPRQPPRVRTCPPSAASRCCR